jgi:hypothetical protein
LVYNLARIFSVIGLIAMAFLLCKLAPVIPFWIDAVISMAPTPRDRIEGISMLTAFASILVALVVTSSTIILGWRADRRQNAKYKLRIKELEAGLKIKRLVLLEFQTETLPIHNSSLTLNAKLVHRC